MNLDAFSLFLGLLLLLLILAGMAGLIVWTLARSTRDASSQMATQQDGLARQLRTELAESGRGGRQELMQAFASFQQIVVQQSAAAIRIQNEQIDAFGQQLTLMQKTLTDTLAQQVGGLAESNARRLQEMRDVMEKNMGQLQAANEAKLDQIRHTVDEKLQATLHQRLGESFKQVAERLELVHRGLGEMQTLAQGVGDLKHLLTNVKTRGIFGEAQLAALLEQVLVADQYQAQVATRPQSRALVDFAIRLPGRSTQDQTVWLPIDAKFPNDDYERLLDAQQAADPVAAQVAAKALESRIRTEAKSIAEKYIEPPYTTDFAILFLPSEGLYAEVLRRPGLMADLQRDHRITLAGPTTLLAMLSSLQMGFRTLAIEKRSSEVWQVLGAVKTEFGKFGDVLAKVKSQTETVLNTLNAAETRSRAMGRVLRTVEAVPGSAVPGLGLGGDLLGSTDGEGEGP